MSRELIIVRSWIVPLFLGRLRAMGPPGAVDDVLRRFELPASVGLQMPVEVPLGIEQKLPDLVAQVLGDPCAGLHLAQSLPRGMFGLLEFAGRSASTLGSALDVAIRHTALVDTHTLLAIEARGPHSRFTLRIPGEPICYGRQGNEFMAALLVGLVRDALHPQWSPTGVVFAHARPQHTAELEAYFGAATYEFGVGSCALVFAPGDLERPLATADHALHGVLDNVASELTRGQPSHSNWIGGVRTRLASMLERGEPTLGKLASALRTSARTLQRRLAADRIRFDELLTEVRRERALELLARAEVTLDDVAFRLGYSDFSTFSRAFRRWTGSSPGEHRAKELASRAKHEPRVDEVARSRRPAKPDADVD